ncbi:radical SAM protein [Sphingobacterium siyangense]|uniref:radical SAM protein n=1 Tax=Sphingobacterium siyangense TaxID=459529 RepID=UPI00196249C7|nr:radical SAM protein [Sphingobacterium siyangense]QRY55976.1 radical SAM protein [Sphingobacterium siyangense]
MIELRLLGTKCNIGCQYCYQNPLRNSGNGNSTYDLEKVFRILDDTGEPFILWGGEPLLLNIIDLEKVLSFGFERFGENNLLTNGILITEKHFDLFKKYNVNIGLSIDGPDELNDVRWAGTVERTREYTRIANENLVKLLQSDIATGLNFQITKCNSSPERISRMFDWLSSLDQLGLTTARIHVLEVDYSEKLKNHAFSTEENIVAFRQYKHFEKQLNNVRFDLFDNMRSQLLALEQPEDCVWSACDAYTTEAVSGIDGQGRKNNCGNTDKEGINFQKPRKQGYERYLALYHVPDKYGGCQNCRFFLQCKGQCPGTAKDGDWRNKSENCALFKVLFEEIEQEIVSEGITPISLHPNRKFWEKKLLDQWADGKNPPLYSLINN